MRVVPVNHGLFVITRDFVSGILFLMLYSYTCTSYDLGNILYKYGLNYNLDNKVICINMTGGLCICARQNFHNEIHLSKILLYI